MSVTLDSLKNKMIGKTFGKLTILEHIGRSVFRENRWRCICECGTELEGTTNQVNKSYSACTKCKIYFSEKSRKAREAFIGQRFGRLTVIAFDCYTPLKSIKWKCKCDCGNEISTLTYFLKSGTTKSCGCYAREQVTNLNKTHGLHKHPLYGVWWAMKQRCYKNTSQYYEHYGARGITICQEWLSYFMNFYNWAMENGYEKGLTIERVDNNGNYEPNNCKWATRKEQVRNTRRVRINPDDIPAIKADPRTNKVVAADYGVNESTISRIRTGFTWA